MIFSSMKRNGIILAAFAAVATALLITVQWATADRIAAQQRNEVMRTLNELVPLSTYSNDLYRDCTLVVNPDALGIDSAQPVYRARDNNNHVALVVRTTAPDGYSGAIHLLVAIAPSGTILGSRVLQHRETPGLGDKIELRKSNWILSFTNQRVNGENDPRWAVRRDGGAFDQFTGATITPRAVINAIQRTALWAQANSNALFTAPANCDAATQGVGNE